MQQLGHARLGEDVGLGGVFVEDVGELVLPHVPVEVQVAHAIVHLFED